MTTREGGLVTPIGTIEVFVAVEGGVDAMARAAAELVRRTRVVGAEALVGAVAAVSVVVAYAAYRYALLSVGGGVCALEATRWTAVSGTHFLVALVLTIVDAIA